MGRRDDLPGVVSQPVGEHFRLSGYANAGLETLDRVPDSAVEESEASVGLFKAMKDIARLTKQAKRLQDHQQVQAGYKPGTGGMMSQMGDMVGQMTGRLKDLADQSGDQQRLLVEGIPGEAVILAMGTPARGAQRYNLDLDLEVHVSGQAPYRVANQYIVPASAPIGQGVRLPVRVDPNDQAKIAIDWDNVAQGPARGEVRPVSGAQPPDPAQGPAGGMASPTGGGGGGDTVAALERLAKLRDSGALTNAEFEHAKAAILGS